MRRPIFVTTAVAAMAAVTLVAGCGSGSSGSTSSKTPQAALNTGIDGLTNTDVLTVTIKLDTSPVVLQALAKAGGDNLDAATAKVLTSGSLVFESKTTNGKKLNQLKPSDANATSSEFSFVSDGISYAEIRTLAGTLYLRADVKGLLDLFGKSNVYKELQARAATLPKFATAGVDGKWISLDVSMLKALAGQLGGGATTPNAEQSKKFLAALRGVIDKDVTATRVGTDASGDHLRLTGHTKQLATDLLQALQQSIPAAGLALSKENPSKITDHSVVVDVWVKNGALSKLSLETTQFAPAGEVPSGVTVPIVVTFDRSGPDVAKPADVTPVDLTSLAGLLGSLGA